MQVHVTGAMEIQAVNELPRVLKIGKNFPEY